MSEHDVAVLDSTLHYRESGKGDPIVFLHGNPTSSYLWRNVIPRLESEGRCLAPDLIGMGQSGKPDIEYRFVDHARYLDEWFAAMDLRRVTLVLHDWGSALGFHWARRHPDRVAGIAFMEAIVRPLLWSEWPEQAREVFRAFRTPKVGEDLIFGKNVFIENVLPGSIARKLAADEMDAYRAPFRDPKSRKPVWRWPNEIPLDGQPRDVVEIVTAYARWLGESPVPKLLLTFEPGAILGPKLIDYCKANFANLEIVHAGRGIHFVQEDEPESIGDSIKQWRRRKGIAG
ncbi:MAG: haloalkane dehalogenase [Candidatus Binatia bacterium]